MATESFFPGDTVITELESKALSGADYDPTTSVKLSIYDPSEVLVVTAQDMTKDATGRYHYDYTLGAAAEEGQYKAVVVCTSGTRVKSFVDYFEVKGV